MVTEIKMPRLSQTTDEVRLIRWLVAEGDMVEKGDPLCEVETDKVTMEVESFTGGAVLKLVAKPDTIVDAGTVIALLGEPGEQVAEDYGYAEGMAAARDSVSGIFTEEAKAASGGSGTAAGKSQETGAIQKIVTQDQIMATPLVRNIARKQGIDLSLVKGTGARGLITKRDLELFLSGTVKTAAAGRLSGGKECALSRNQTAVAMNIVKSKTEIPHYYLKTMVFFDPVLKLIDASRKNAGNKLSMYSFFIYAAAGALKEYPALNGYFRDNRVILMDRINICFAVEAGEELFVPVIHDADKKSIEEIDIDVKRLVSKARNSTLGVKDIRDGTFTVTNLGVYPVDDFYAIINYPQLGILAMGEIKKTLFIDENDAMSIRRLCTVTGSFDHRCVNGARGAAFLQKFKQVLEEL